MTLNGLMPCPFCGRLETLRMIYVPAEKSECVYHVVCDAVNGGCGASTGWNHSTPEEAAEEWNARASGWIPCSEILPKHTGDVLIFVDDCIYMAHLSTDKKEFAVGSYEMWWNVEEVSHWMPLPDPPKGDAE